MSVPDNNVVGIRKGQADWDSAVLTPPELVKRPDGRNDGSMDAPTREEIDAKLRASQAEMRGEFNTSFARIEGTLGQVLQKLDGLSTQVSETRSEIRDNRRHTQALIVTSAIAVIGFVLAGAFGVVQSVQGHNSALLSALQSGIAIGGAPGHAAPPSPAPPAPAK